MKVSNSKVKVWRRCPKKYEFKYVYGLRSKQRKIQLERGTWLHDLLMHHYDGEDWMERHAILTKEFYKLFEEEREDLGDLPDECGRIMRSYVRSYKQEDEQYVTVDSELDEIITLPNGLRVQVIIDLIVEDRGGGLWIWDHKTRKKFENAENMILDPQLSLYYYCAELMGYKPLRGALYNEILTKPPTIPKLTAKTHQLERRANLFTDVFTYLTEIKRHDFNPEDYSAILRTIALKQKDRFFRRTAIPKDPPVLRQVMRDTVDSALEMERAERRNRFPRTYDGSCRWGCDFIDICFAQLHGADIEPMIRQSYEVKPRKEEDEYEPRVHSRRQRTRIRR